MRHPLHRCVLIGLIVVLTSATAWAAGKSQHPPSAAIASAHPLATRAGSEILAQGGNAFDASIAVAAALAVVEPYSSGLGGGGFWLLHRARDAKQVMIDGRERAPLAAQRDMYLDDRGQVIPNASINGPLSAGIPGTPAALVHLADHFGRLPLATSLEPAIRLAEEGFTVDKVYRRLAQFRLEALRKSPAAASVFLHDGEVPPLETKVTQSDLAQTLRRLAQEGRKGFYAGTIARKLVEGVRAAGGIWELEDLEAYQVVERAPITGHYRGIRITSAALPSSGGVGLVQMLNVLSGYPLSDVDSVTRIHLIVEAMRRSYRDRAVYLGDTDYVPVPIERLTHPFYAAGLRASILPDRATPSAMLPGPSPADPESHHTTHFSILDGEGNRVAATLSINYPFGSGFVAPGTGVLLNDEMDDFVAKPGEPNAYGLVGSDANTIAPGKRMLSSMSPTFLEDDNRIAILGTPGGSRIITSVLLATLEFAGGADAQALASAPRFHHQYLPDEIQIEPEAIPAKGQEQLTEMGHHIKRLKRPYGNMQVVIWDKTGNKVDAAADPRGIGGAIKH